MKLLELKLVNGKLTLEGNSVEIVQHFIPKVIEEWKYHRDSAKEEAQIRAPRGANAYLMGKVNKKTAGSGGYESFPVQYYIIKRES